MTMSALRVAVEHGKRSSYVTGCHCQLCRDANTVYQASRLRTNPQAAEKKKSAVREWKRSARGRATAKAWADRNRDKLRGRQRAHRAENREACNARAGESWRRLQAKTMDSASNARRPWTCADDRLLLALLDTAGVSRVEAATQLGRTFGAVVNRQSKLRGSTTSRNPVDTRNPAA